MFENLHVGVSDGPPWDGSDQARSSSRRFHHTTTLSYSKHYQVIIIIIIAIIIVIVIVIIIIINIIIVIIIVIIITIIVIIIICVMTKPFLSKLSIEGELDDMRTETVGWVLAPDSEIILLMAQKIFQDKED